MNIASSIAFRYLVSKKSTNVINIITWISVVGLAIGTAALILILSVFNGFETLLTGMLSNFNPDLKIVPKEGKFSEVDSLLYQKLLQIDGVQQVSITLEETAFFTYKNSQDVGILKGVDSRFAEVSGIDSSMISGEFTLNKKTNTAVLGTGMYTKLSINPSDIFTPLETYAIANITSSPLSKEYETIALYPSGYFSVGNDIDMQYILVRKEVADSLLNKSGQLSAYELKIKNDDSINAVKRSVKTLLDNTNLTLKDRYEQDAAFLKIMNIEKWISYLIVSLTMLIIAFNMVGSLWMIVLEKRLDISILKSMGMTSSKVKNLFIRLGLFMTFAGIAVGLILAFVLYFLQKQYGLIQVPDGFLIDAYPIELRITDFIVVIVTVSIIGFIASLIPAFRASKIGLYYRAE